MVKLRAHSGYLLLFGASRSSTPRHFATLIISWLKDEAEDLYDPEYSDIVRVAGLVGFSRGKASSIVSELSGRDPETRKVDEERIPIAYEKLERALFRVVTNYHFDNFVMLMKSAGVITAGMVNSKNTLNFAVKGWFVMSMLTGRGWEGDSPEGAATASRLVRNSRASWCSCSRWGRAAVPRPVPSASLPLSPSGAPRTGRSRRERRPTAPTARRRHARRAAAATSGCCGG